MVMKDNQGLFFALKPKNDLIDTGSTILTYGQSTPIAQDSHLNELIMKEKKYLERYDQTVRYSLIITIRVPEIECDIYTPVSNEIEVSQVVENIQDVSTATEI